MIKNFYIEGELMDFNTFQNKTRTNKFIGSKIKKQETERVYWECKKQRVSPAQDYPLYITFRWFLKNGKKDLDNICFAKKFILDGMVMAGVLSNDSQKFISGFKDEFHLYPDNPHIEIEW